jgi:integrase/recombinase XerD
MFNENRIFEESTIFIMITAKVLLYKSNKKKDGTIPLVMRIIRNRKPEYIPIGINLTEEQWDSKEKRVKKSHPNASQINFLIIKKLSEVNDVLIEAETQDKNVNAKQVQKKLVRKKQRITFNQFATEFIEDKMKQGKINVAGSDKSRLNNIKRFLGNEEIYFTDITTTLLEKLRVYLKSNNESSTRTIMNHFLFMRTLFNKAIRDGIVDAKYYPFGKEKIKIKMPESMKIGMDEEEMKKITQLNLPENSPKFHARNVWMFSFYFAGMRISDVLKIKWSDFSEGRLHYRMGKNEKVLSIQVPEKVSAILKHYESDRKKSDDFVFPDLKKADMKNHQDVYTKVNTACKRLNKHLKSIAKQTGIDKNISNHIARHTFGNIAGDKISPQMLQKLYRHSDIRTTMGYQANFIHKTADDALESVINF